MTTAAIIRRRRRNRGGTGRGLAAPTIVWDGDIGDLLPDFSITYNARINDTIIIRRTQTTDFSTYDEASDTVLSFDPPTSLEFDFGGDWPVGPWRVKVYFMRAGRMSDLSDTITIALDTSVDLGTDGVYLDFINDVAVIKDTATPANAYTGVPFSKLTFTRASAATYVNSAGVITSAANDAPRIDYDPASLVVKGFLTEQAKTNLLRNSTINGANLATQSVTVSATAYTLSFYGTGTVTLSGVSTAGPLVGSGDYPTRSTLTFTPTAGSLTLTVSGTVQFANLEAGSFATSFIPTAGAAATRATDVVSLATTTFNHSATETTLIGEGIWGAIGSVPTRVVQMDDGTESNRMCIMLTSTQTEGRATVATANVASITTAATTTSAVKVGFRLKLNDFATVTAGGAASTDTSGNYPPGMTTLRPGNITTGSSGQVWVRKIVHLPRVLTNAELQTATT